MYIRIVSEKLYQNTFKDIQTTFKIICGFACKGIKTGYSKKVPI